MSFYQNRPIFILGQLIEKQIEYGKQSILNRRKALDSYQLYQIKEEEIVTLKHELKSTIITEELNIRSGKG